MSFNEIIDRVKINWKLKIALGLFLNAMFALLYLVPQHFPLFKATIVKPITIDNMLPFSPDSIYMYESLYLLMPIAPWLMKTKGELKRYSLGIVLMTFLGFCFFVFFPTSFPRNSDMSNTNFLYNTVISLDTELNAFPSLHAAFAIFHCACCFTIFNSGPWHRAIRFFFMLWTFGILLATLLTKQHVFLDLLGGVFLGGISFIIFFQLKMLFSLKCEGIKVNA